MVSRNTPWSRRNTPGRYGRQEGHCPKELDETKIRSPNASIAYPSRLLVDGEEIRTISPLGVAEYGWQTRHRKTRTAVNDNRGMSMYRGQGRVIMCQLGVKI